MKLLQSFELSINPEGSVSIVERERERPIALYAAAISSEQKKLKKER
jgi:hypothetical protein